MTSRFNIDECVEKISGSSWRGRVVGFYSTSLTMDGCAVESENEPGSVQIYPASALRLAGERQPYTTAPEGWVMVPREATEAMRVQAYEAYQKGASNAAALWDAIWSAMIAAAPANGGSHE